jgi:GAF domain-containing protein/HAMP domain-containing protein
MKADVDRNTLQDQGGPPSPGAGRPDAAASLSRASTLRSRLFVKYVALLITVVVLALVANGAFEVWFSYQENKSTLIDTQRLQAQAAADKIEEFITQIDSQVGWTTQLPWTDGTLDQRRFDALRLLRQVPAITELAQIDASGHEQLKVSRLTMDVVGSGIDYSDKPEFKLAVANKVYYGPVYFRRESEPYMTIALAGARRDSGVSVAQVNLKLIWDVVSKIKVGVNGRAYVVDGGGRLIAHPDISLVLRNTDMNRLAQVESARAGSAGDAVQETLDVAGHKVLTAFAPVNPLGWFVFVETPVAEAYAPLYASIQRTGYVLFGALALAFVAGIFLAGRMVVPIQALRAGAARIGSGDLSQRINIKTGDEVEALADQFNAMAGQLQESYADLEKKVDLRTHELSESLKQQTATSEVLRVISSSPGELTSVFEAILANAQRICDAKFGNLVLFDGTNMRVVAMHNASREHMEMRQRDPIVPLDRSIMGPLVRTKKLIHVADITAEEPYASSPLAKAAGMRTALAVPMLKDEELVGAIAIFNAEVRPFTDKQIELLENFAAQAVIAIENTRLLTELRESLEQQTATADVLRVISSSPGDLDPVFEAILENATRICEAGFGVLSLKENDGFRVVAMHNAPPAFAALRQRDPKFKPSGRMGALMAKAIAAKHAVQLADFAEPSDDPLDQAFGAATQARSIILVPMLKDNEVIGTSAIFRQEVRPFSDKQVELLTNFANQAVIAIENARLLSELRQSLEQQTATAEVLSVISSSPGDLDPVFQTMLENATRICESNFGVLQLPEEGGFRMVAMHNAPSAYAEARRRDPVLRPSHPLLPPARVAATKQTLHIPDMSQEAAYKERDPAAIRFVEVAGVRTLLMVPMLKENELVGLISIYRQEVRPFTEKQIELVQNFAAQAVIAIENTRLLSELRESLEQQTATAEVLRVISSSPGDLEPVFNAMLENSTRICGAKFGLMFLSEGGSAYRTVAMYGAPAEFIQVRLQSTITPNPGTTIGHVDATKEPFQIADVQSEPAYLNDPNRADFLKLTKARTVLNVPMLKDDAVVGQIAIYRQEVEPFTDKQIALLTNFAAQAVIAIENTRLLNELRQRTQELSASLHDLRAAQDRLVQSEKLASLGQLTAGIAHEIKNPLNFVNNFSSVSAELIQELNEILGTVNTDEKTREEIEDLAQTLRGNLEKIVQHGKRADSIVKNMLLHSREGSGEHRPVDINGVVEESLNLAYHGARAEKQGFNITLERAFDPAAGEVDLYPQEITRVLLNLISNGFYAATKRKAQAGDGFEPILSASTKNLGDRVEIRIRDNGTGIPPEVKAKMFNPFFTTKPAGEGTGLGLSISHDIIVKQHAGSIVVDTEPGRFTEFKIVLPRMAAAIAKPGGRA